MVCSTLASADAVDPLSFLASACQSYQLNGCLFDTPGVGVLSRLDTDKCLMSKTKLRTCVPSIGRVVCLHTSVSDT